MSPYDSDNAKHRDSFFMGPTLPQLYILAVDEACVGV